MVLYILSFTQCNVIMYYYSAGIGRTGTFIAIDVMLQKIAKKEPLDVMNFVCRMRAQRSNMVQNCVRIVHSFSHHIL